MVREHALEIPGTPGVCAVGYFLKAINVGAVGKWNLPAICSCAAKGVAVYIEGNISFPGGSKHL